MKLFKNKKRFAATFAAIATVMTLGWALAAYTNVLNPVFGNDTAFANPPADACIKVTDGINVNGANANATIDLTAGCGTRKLVMKAWYAPSATGVPHDAQVLFAEGERKTLNPSDAPYKFHVRALPAGCFYQYDVVDITNPPNNGYPIVAAVTGGNRDCTPQPAPNFACTGLTASPGAVDQNNGNQAFTFTTTASVKRGTIQKYTYTFGDGTSAAAPSNATSNTVVHTFAPGNYTTSVVVTVRGDDGKTYTTNGGAPCVANITVKPPQQPDKKLSCDKLTATPGAVQQNGNQSYSFTANASVENTTITSYVFNFGDGDSQTVNTGATTANATHTYAPGEYDATVTVNAGAQQATSEACKVHIKVKKPEAKLACVKLTATPGAVSENGNQSYSFNASATAQNTTITSYVFDFGDGSDDATVTTGATTATTSHTYAPGEYTAMVTVKAGDQQATSEACKVTIKVKPPQAKLKCDSLTATPGAVDQSNGNQAFSFTANASAQNTTITSYVFNFGDGQNQTVNTGATTANASHTYAPGDYTATVTVKAGEQQATSEACKVKIHVEKQKEGKLVCTSLSATAGEVAENGNQAFSFTATATKNNATITNYVFNFGDGSTDSTVTTGDLTAEADHTYAPGTYTATVKVNGTDNAGKPISSADVAACKYKVTVKPPQPKNPDIKLTKTVDGVKSKQVAINQNFFYQLVITNTGEKDLTNAKVTDPAPAGVTMLSADKGEVANNSFSYTIPSLKVGESVTVNITAVVKEYVAGNMVNTACVDASEIEGNPDSCDTATVTVPPVVTPPTTTPPQVLGTTTATTLVNVGPGSVATIAIAVAAISAIGYNFVLGRKLTR